MRQANNSYNSGILNVVRHLLFYTCSKISLYCLLVVRINFLFNKKAEIFGVAQDPLPVGAF